MRTTQKSAGMAVLLLASTLTACGGKADESSSGVAGSKRLDDLSQNERVKLCDYMASSRGGYGMSIVCNDELVLESVSSQAECLMDLELPCRATVADAEACVDELSCSELLPSACIPFLECGRVELEGGDEVDDRASGTR